MKKEEFKNIILGIILCFVLAVPCYILGVVFPLIGGAIIAIVAGIIISSFVEIPVIFKDGVSFTSKKILQLAVILLGFGLNLSQVMKVGATSLPIIISTIATALIVAFILQKIMKLPGGLSTLIGVGSSICGGSAIAATAPVIKAKDDEIAQSIAVIFLFNIIAALVFPSLGNLLHLSNEGFALFAGTAVNDTSSVTATASAWDGMHMGANTLDSATIVKLTRTLAIIPITMVLALIQSKKEIKLYKEQPHTGQHEFSDNKPKLSKIFPVFIIFFLMASIITTALVSVGVDSSYFHYFKLLSKFFIIMAMMAIGLNTKLVKLVKTGGKSIIMGFICWIAITLVSLAMQFILHLD